MTFKKMRNKKFKSSKKSITPEFPQNLLENKKKSEK
jgi:hypothetical protein